VFDFSSSQVFGISHIIGVLTHDKKNLNLFLAGSIEIESAISSNDNWRGK